MSTLDEDNDNRTDEDINNSNDSILKTVDEIAIAEELKELDRRTDMKRAFTLYADKEEFLKANKEEYIKYGYAPGQYLFSCRRCKLMMQGDKRASICWLCVDKLKDSISFPGGGPDEKN